VRAQITLEFMALTVLMLLYLTTVAGVYSQAKRNLEEAADVKVMEDVEKWIYFMNQRPVESEIRIDVKPYPGRYLSIECEHGVTVLKTPSRERKMYVPSKCESVEIWNETCLRIVKKMGGVLIEIC